MSLYVPAMQRRDSSVYYNNTAKSFLDGVRMQRDYEQQKAVQDNMLQQQEMARQASARADKESARADRKMAMIEDEYGMSKAQRKADVTVAQSNYEASKANKKVVDHEADMRKIANTMERTWHPTEVTLSTGEKRMVNPTMNPFKDESDYYDELMQNNPIPRYNRQDVFSQLPTYQGETVLPSPRFLPNAMSRETSIRLPHETLQMIKSGLAPQNPDDVFANQYYLQNNLLNYTK